MKSDLAVSKQLVERSASPAAKWVQQHGDVLFAYAMARLHDHNSAEDLVQETLLAAMDAHDRFAGLSSVRTWLTGILRNKLHEHYREKRRHATAQMAMLDDVVDQEFSSSGRWSTGPGRWGQPLQSQMQREEFRKELSSCLAKLPGPAAEAFLLAEHDGMSAERISQVLGISSANNVYVILHRARSALRQCLERNWVSTHGDRG